MAKNKKDKEDDDDQDTGVKDISSDLDEIDDWDDTEEDEGFSEIPRSKQAVKIEKAYINRAKSESKRLQIVLELEIAAGKYKGRKLFSRLGLTDPEQRGRTRGVLAKLGLDWPSKKKLPKVVAGLEDTYAQVTVSPNDGGGMPNAFIDKAIDESDLEAYGDSDEDAGDKKSKKTKSKSKEKDDDDDDDDEDEDDDKKSSKSKSKSKSKEDDDDDDDDDEPKKGKKSKDDDDEDEDEDDDDKSSKSKSKKSKDEDEDDDDDDEDDKKSKDKDDAKVDCDFKDKDLDDDQVERIKTLAKKNDFKPKQYDSMVDLLGDVAEYVGVSGEFSSAKKLIKAIKEKMDE